MNWLKKPLDLSVFKFYELGKHVLAVSDEMVKWIRIPQQTFSILKRLEGSSLKAVYVELGKLESADKPGILELLKFFGSGDIEKNFYNYEEKSVFFLITQRCNLKCLTCYVNAEDRTVAEEMEIKENEEIFRQLCSLGYASITLSGGEPLLHPNIKEIIELSRKFFKTVNLNTNGILLDRNTAAFLKNQDVNIMVSLESFNPEINDSIRGSGVYSKVMQTLKYLKEAGHDKITISMTLTNLNLSEVVKMHEFCVKEGFQEHYGVFVESGRGRCNSDYLKVNAGDQADTYFNLLRERSELEEANLKVPDFLTKCATYCGAIKSIVNIMPNGDVYPCPNLIDPVWRMGNIRQTGLTDILDQSAVAKMIISRDVRGVAGCNSCRIRFICGGGCMANAYISSGDINNKDPLCELYDTVLSKQLEKWDVNKSYKENIIDIMEVNK